MFTSLFLLAAFSLLDARVEIPYNAEPSTRLCVEELTNYVSKISGKILQVEVEGRGRQWKGPSVVVGTLKTLKNVPERARTALANAKQYEAAWMGTDGGDLWIVGKEETADLYATYHFLETKLGVRWFQAAIPEDPGDWYPSQKEIVIEDFAEFREPDFKYRMLCQNSSYWNVIAKPGITCAIRNGYNFGRGFYWLGKDQSKLSKTDREFKEFFEPRISKRNFSAGGGHGIFFEAFPKDKYFPLHPEWFPLINGKRQVSHGQCCQSNTNLLQAIVDKALERFALTGGYGSFSFGNTDYIHGWCECDACRALDGPGEDPYGTSPNVASRICFMASYIAPRIWAKYPNATLTCFPYSCYRSIPKKGAYDPRCECQFCDHGRCYGHTLDDPTCVRNVKMLAEMKPWLAKLPNLWTFEYFTDTPPMYVCRERDEQRDLKFYKSLGMIGWFNEGAMTGSKFVDWVGKDIGEMQPSNWQYFYATGHVLWNTDLDLDALLADAETKYYGVAAKPMREYHNFRRDLWNSRRECMGYPSGDARRPLLLNAAGSKERLLALLDEAERLIEVESKSEKVKSKELAVLRFRIGRDRKWLTNYWIKPNEKARAMAANSLSVPKATSPIKIDGDRSDAAWLGALYPNDRFRKVSEGEKGRGTVPNELRTSVGLTTDGENLYFLVEANEPHMDRIKSAAKSHDGPVWGDDGVELMIFSPSVENCYYHIAVNTKGVVYDARCPGNDTKYDLGVEAKGSPTEKGWLLEIKVPTKKIYPLVEGDKWRIQVVRNSTTCGPYGGSVSFGGFLPHDTSEYLTFEFGSSCAVNGSFDDVDEKGKPKNWLVYNGEVRKEGANSVLFTKSFTAQTYRHGPLGKSDESRKLKYSFRAKGKGKVKVEFVRYDDAKKSGEWMPKPWGRGGEYELKDDVWTTYTGTYAINPGEYVAIAFAPPPEDCLIDDVNVTREE